MSQLATYLLLLLCITTVSATSSDVATDLCSIPFNYMDDQYNITERFWCSNGTTHESRRLEDDGIKIPDISGIISSGINAYNMVKNYLNPDSQNCEVVTSLLPDTPVCALICNPITHQCTCLDRWQTKMKFAFESNTGRKSDFWVNSANAVSPTDSFYQGRTRSGNLGTGEGLRSVSFSFRASSCLKYVAFSCGSSISAANEANLLIGVNWVYEKFWREGKTNMARCGPFGQGQAFPGLDYVLGMTISGAAFACGGDNKCILNNINTYGFPSNQWN